MSKLSPHSAVRAVFGNPKFKAQGTTTWLALEAWFTENIVGVSFPKFGVSGNFHYKVVRQLYLAMNKVASSVSTSSARTTIVQKINCHYSPRTIPSKPGTVSYHSYGIAVDINATRPKNGFRTRKSTEPNGYYFDQDPILVKAMESHGFTWGGRWGLAGEAGRNANEYGKVDAMHFEAGTWFASSSDRSKSDLSDIAKDTENIMINYTPAKFRTYTEGDETITQEEALGNSQPETIIYDPESGEVTISAVEGGVTAIAAERVYLY